MKINIIKNMSPFIYLVKHLDYIDRITDKFKTATP